MAGSKSVFQHIGRADSWTEIFGLGWPFLWLWTENVIVPQHRAGVAYSIHCWQLSLMQQYRKRAINNASIFTWAMGECSLCFKVLHSIDIPGISGSADLPCSGHSGYTGQKLLLLPCLWKGVVLPWDKPKCMQSSCSLKQFCNKPLIGQKNVALQAL